MDKLKNHDTLCHFMVDGKKVLGMDTGLTPKSLIRTEFSDIRKENSYVLKSSELETFNFDQRGEFQGNVVLYSKDHSFDFFPLNNGSLESIAELLYFLNILKGNEINIDHYSDNQFYKDENGNMILLSPKIISFINESRSLASNQEHVSKYKHPNLTGEKLVLFSVGTMLFQQITGEYPYQYDTVEDLRDKIRRSQFIKPQWLKPNLKDEVVETITALLSGEHDFSYELILQKVEDYIKNGVVQEDNSQIENLEKQYKREYKQFKFYSNARAFLVKNKGRLIISGIALLFVGSFFGTIIYNALQPPITAGFSPTQVVESYFSSFHTLDTDLMDDVLKRGVRKRISDELASVYVTTKMRGQYEGLKATYTPAEWYELPDDKKNLVFVYGIDQLEIEKVSDLVFNVVYEKWASHPNPIPSEPGFQDIMKWVYEEEFTLEETKYSYEISNIETLKEEEIKVW